MKILVMVPDLVGRGGVVNYYNALRPHFSAQVDFFVRGSRFEAARLRKCWLYVTDYVRFVRSVASGQYDLVHLNTSLTPVSTTRDIVFLVLAKLLRRRVVVFFRGWNREFETRLRGLRLSVFRATILRADGCIVLAAAFGIAIRRWGFANPIFVESTAVDTTLIDRAQGSAQKLTKGPYINLLYLSRVEENKGIFTLLDAYSVVKAHLPHLRLVVAGDGRDLSASRSYAASRGLRDVQFLGHVSGERKADALRQADIFILPTRHGEGMPNSVLEAMACGLAVITRPVGGVRDFFMDGVMGRLVEDAGVESLTAAIEELATDPERCRRVSSFNRTYAAERFSALQVARRLEDIYEGVIAGAYRDSREKRASAGMQSYLAKSALL